MNALPLTAIGRTFFAIALLGLGVEHIVFQEFVTGRAPPWPAGVPGKELWATVSGVLVFVAGVCLVMRQWGRQAMLGLALFIGVWALLRHVPIVAGDALLAGSWTRAGKALTFFGGSLAVAATLPPIVAGGWSRYANATAPFIRLGGICLGCFLIVSGLQHFKFTPFVITLIPAWFPGNHTLWAQLAGIALIAGGLGLLFKRTAGIAGLMVGVMIFSWFWIVHVPRTFLSVSDGIALFEALAFSGLALVVGGPAPWGRFHHPDEVSEPVSRGGAENHQRRGDHSLRSVTAGSTAAARRAGAQHARAATPPSRTITPAYVAGSAREIP